MDTAKPSSKKKVLDLEGLVQTELRLAEHFDCRVKRAKAYESTPHSPSIETNDDSNDYTDRNDSGFLNKRPESSHTQAKAKVMEQLLELETRDILPEDYDLLICLDKT